MILGNVSSSAVAVSSAAARAGNWDGVFPLFRTSTLPYFSFNPSSPSSDLQFSQGGKKKGVMVVRATTKEAPLSGIVFQPFEEVKSDKFSVPMDPQRSLARQRFSEDSEAAINRQINVEYNDYYIYRSFYAYFDRDNVALKGFAKFFKEASEVERLHAEKLMDYQNKRGGRVLLYNILKPRSELDNSQKGQALHAMAITLQLEKLTHERLLDLHHVAAANNDPQMCDFVESEFLTPQVKTIKKISEYVTQLRMVEEGHGVWHFDQMLLHEGFPLL